jgi:two-component system, chemotaxis family, chemotaxis protein CheY
MSSAQIPSVAPLGRSRILVVDDSPAARDALCASLRRAGFNTSEAAEGSEALWRARSAPFDAVLTDIHMPTMDGLEFIRQLRGVPGYDKTPVFVVTSDVSRARFVEGRQVGATAWLVKPPNMAALVTAVRDALTSV